jgi:hypothetical protein
MKRGYFAFLPYRYRILLGYGILPGYFPIRIPYVSAIFLIKKNKKIRTQGGYPRDTRAILKGYLSQPLSTHILPPILPLHPTPIERR